MKKPGTFSGRAPKTPESPPDPFIHELIETGRANWKKAPKEVRTRYRGIFLILFSIPFILLPGWEMGKRVTGHSTKKVQEGEILENGVVRKFDEAEKWKTEKESLMYKIFGKDFYLDGFTKDSMTEEKSGKK